MGINVGDATTVGVNVGEGGGVGVKVGGNVGVRVGVGVRVDVMAGASVRTGVAVQIGTASASGCVSVGRVVRQPTSNAAANKPRSSAVQTPARRCFPIVLFDWAVRISGRYLL